jgi:hypothetical protein
MGRHAHSQRTEFKSLSPRTMKPKFRFLFDTSRETKIILITLVPFYFKYLGVIKDTSARRGNRLRIAK